MLRSLQLVQQSLVGNCVQLQASSCFGLHRDLVCRSQAAAQVLYQLAAHQQCSAASFSSNSSSERNAGQVTAILPVSSWMADLQQRCTSGLLQVASGRKQSMLQISQQAAVGFPRYQSGTAGKEQTQFSPRNANHMKKIREYEFKSRTLGTVTDEYRRPESVFKAGVLPDPVATAQWVYKRLRGRFMSYTTALQARTHIPGYEGEALLKEQFADMYKKINEAQANYEIDKVKDLIDERLYTRMRAQANERQIGRWSKIFFELVEDADRPLSKNMKIVRRRAIQTDDTSPIVWFQYTCRIRSKQRFAAYSYHIEPGKERVANLVFGNPDEVIDVEDHWVFEYKAKPPTDKQKSAWPNSRWRVVARLAV